MTLPALAIATPIGERSRRRIDVRPSRLGWCVEAESVERVVFTRGADAERHGRELGSAFADLGYDVVLRIGGRDGWLVATLSWTGVSSAGFLAPPVEVIIGEPRPMP